MLGDILTEHPGSEDSSGDPDNEEGTGDPSYEEGSGDPGIEVGSEDPSYEVVDERKSEELILQELARRPEDLKPAAEQGQGKNQGGAKLVERQPDSKEESARLIGRYPEMKFEQMGIKILQPIDLLRSG